MNRFSIQFLGWLRLRVWSNGREIIILFFKLPSCGDVLVTFIRLNSAALTHLVIQLSRTLVNGKLD